MRFNSIAMIHPYSNNMRLILSILFLVHLPCPQCYPLRGIILPSILTTIMNYGKTHCKSIPEKRNPINIIHLGACVSVPPPPTHTHTCARTRTRACARAHTHTHTHTHTRFHARACECYAEYVFTLNSGVYSGLGALRA
jgi:hypothetical protein